MCFPLLLHTVVHSKTVNVYSSCSIWTPSASHLLPLSNVKLSDTEISFTVFLPSHSSHSEDAAATIGLLFEWNFFFFYFIQTEAFCCTWINVLTARTVAVLFAVETLFSGSDLSELCSVFHCAAEWGKVWSESGINCILILSCALFAVWPTFGFVVSCTKLDLFSNPRHCPLVQWETRRQGRPLKICWIQKEISLEDKSAKTGG